MVSALLKLFFLFSCANLFVITSVCAKEAKLDKKPQKEKVELSNYDKRVLDNGEIGGFRHAAGSVLAVVPGFGLGHAVQGRYLYKGMIFTLLEISSVAIMFGPTGDGGLGIGFVSLLGFKIWEFVDAIVGPIRHNRRYHQLQSFSLESPESPLKILPVPIVKNHESGQRTTHLGLAISWAIP